MITPDLPFEYQNGKIHFKEIPRDSVIVCFTPLNSLLVAPRYQRDPATYEAGRVSAQKPSLHKQPEPDLFDLKGFNSYGSITRGVGFGNRQNVFVNSALNLQLDGELSENLFVSASITDQNIPYQPEGNTQQVRDFDNIYIKLYNDAFDLTVGDIVFTNPVNEAYFLRYYKNVQGLQLNTEQKLGEQWKSKTTLSGSAAKGQFASIQLEPIEGVQGPYRLIGPNNEQFLIILANSEHVFLDGIELKRGFDRDYVIDYNLAEITFSPSVLITRFSRIRVDFEYADQYYGSSNFNLTEQLSKDSHQVFFSLYQERDNPNNTLGYGLSQEDFSELSLAGDVRIAAISGVDSVGFTENGIFYLKKDTVVEGVPSTIYEYSTDPQVAIYQVSFTNVGTGKGSYTYRQSASNGRIYEWVGAGNGAFEPIVNVPTPNQKRIMVVGSTHRISAFEEIAQEWALSNTDQNLFSDLGDDDNRGWAAKGTFRTIGRAVGDYRLTGSLSYEQLSSSFSAIDRFRSIEFDRNWGYRIFEDSVTQRADKIVSSDVLFKKDAQNYFHGSAAYRDRSQVINGVQTQVDFAKTLGPILLKSNVFLLENDPFQVRNTWVRNVHELGIQTPILTPGYIFTDDRQKSSIQDSVVSTLMNYTSHNFYLKSGDSLKRSAFRVDYIRREDRSPLEGRFQSYTDAEEFRLSSSNQFLNQQLSASAIYREVKDHFIEEKDRTVLGRVDWKGILLNKFVTHSLVYSTASTRELRREYVFIQVPSGQGTHTWRDENEDGVQDLNEFYEAINADERTYIKLFTPTNEYLNAFQSTIQQNMDIRLPKYEGLLRPISRLSFNTNTSINQKTTSTRTEDQLIPFLTGLRNVQILSAKNYRRYSLFYNRNGDGFAADVNYSESEGKSLLSNGFELQKRAEWQTITRISLSAEVTLRIQNAWGSSLNESDFLTTRNFILERRSWSPQVVFQLGTNFRVISKVERRVRETVNQEVENYSRITDYGIESTWTRVSKGSLNASVQWLSIRFQGDANSYLGYELLEGLQAGQNQRWSLNWQQSLNRGLQLSVQYIGRKSPESGAVHTGNMQLTAFF